MTEASGKRSPREVIDFIMRMGDEIKKAADMTDEELAEAVTSKVWGDLDMDSPGSAALEELIERFKKAKKG